MEKYVWNTGETFSSEIEVAHFGLNEIKEAAPICILRDSGGYYE
jgi:hypothetical protein